MSSRPPISPSRSRREEFEAISRAITQGTYQPSLIRQLTASQDATRLNPRIGLRGNQGPAVPSQDIISPAPDLGWFQNMTRSARQWMQRNNVASMSDYPPIKLLTAVMGENPMESIDGPARAISAFAKRSPQLMRRFADPGFHNWMIKNGPAKGYFSQVRDWAPEAVIDDLWQQYTATPSAQKWSARAAERRMHREGARLGRRSSDKAGGLRLERGPSSEEELFPTETQFYWRVLDGKGDEVATINTIRYNDNSVRILEIGGAKPGAIGTSNMRALLSDAIGKIEKETGQAVTRVTGIRETGTHPGVRVIPRDRFRLFNSPQTGRASPAAALFAGGVGAAGLSRVRQEPAADFSRVESGSSTIADDSLSNILGYSARTAAQQDTLQREGILGAQRATYDPTLSEAAYRNITPYAYTGHEGQLVNAARDILGGLTSRLKPSGTGSRPTESPIREDVWRMYLGMPMETRGQINVSPTRPSVERDSDATYYSLPAVDEDIKSMLPGILRSFLDNPEGEENLTEWTDVHTDKSGNKYLIVTDIAANTLGKFKVSIGEDEKGHYISYYDLWDLDFDEIEKGLSDRMDLLGNEGIGGMARRMLAEAAKKKGVGPESVGRPIEFYNRIYFDPETRKPIDK